MKGDKVWQIFQKQDADDVSQLVNIESPRIPRAGVSRRTFIEMIGFSAAALAFSSCRAPEQKNIPNLEGNPEHPLNAGGLCAVAHAMVFGLYDSDRLRQPLIGSQASTWENVDRQINEVFAATKRTGDKVRVLTNSITSPASRQVITQFLGQFKDGKHIVYEAVSNAAIRKAHEQTHQTATIPGYRFDKAKLVVSFGADFLGSWISPTQFTRQYTNARDLRGRTEMSRDVMSRHVQFESLMSLTGSNADKRVKVSPAEEIDSL